MKILVERKHNNASFAETCPVTGSSFKAPFGQCTFLKGTWMAVDTGYLASQAPGISLSGNIIDVPDWLVSPDFPDKHPEAILSLSCTQQGLEHTCTNPSAIEAPEIRITLN